MNYVHPWLWKVESKWLLWLLGLTFALIVTFQYVELPYSISCLFSSTKIPVSRNSTSLIIGNCNQHNGNLTPAMAPTLLPSSSTEVEVDQIFDSSRKTTAPPASLPALDLAPPKENATMPASNVAASVVLPSLKPSTVKENATLPTTSQVHDNNATKTKVGGTSPLVRFVPDIQENAKMPESGVMSISEMSKQLCRNCISHYHLAKKPKWVTKPDLELLQAKHEIENAPIDDKDPLLYAPLYHNVSIFKRSYEMMEKLLKVYVYKEGDKPIMHTPILRGIYASEGWFMKFIESNNKFVTKDTTKAHLFYLPFSSTKLEETLYVKDSHSHRNLIKYLKDYIDFISIKYPFWNQTSGADHFLAACHDWAPSETRKHFPNSIRALCYSDVKEGFVFGKDTSLPETLVRDPKKPLSNIGGKSASKRPTLAFFAGNSRPRLR